VSLRLTECLPEFADELRGLLKDQPDLAASVENLEFIQSCPCEDEFCASFYTLPPPQGTWGDSHENIVLEPETGMIILDVIERQIGMVEVLNRNDVKVSLEKLEL
jgi:hypothetical protein